MPRNNNYSKRRTCKVPESIEKVYGAFSDLRNCSTFLEHAFVSRKKYRWRNTISKLLLRRVTKVELDAHAFLQAVLP